MIEEEFKPYFSDRSRAVLAKVSNGKPISEDEMGILHSLRASAEWDLAKAYRDRAQLGGPGWGPIIQEGREDLDLIQANIDKACIARKGESWKSSI